MADIDKICHVIEYFESPLEIDLVEGKWHEMIGTCPTCNQINFNGMMKFLNPAHWIKGISSIGDGVMIATDIVVYLGVLCILYLLITKIIVPLVRCWVCPMSIFCNGSSSSSKNKNDKRRKEREERRRKDKFVSESEDGARSSSEPHDTLARYHGNHSERHYSSSQYI